MKSLQLVAVLAIVYFVIGVTSLVVRLHPLKQWGIVSVEGEDRLRFLHGLGTNSFVDKVNRDCFPNCFLNAQVNTYMYIRDVVLYNL
jgi:folate-binding Fe-S cluster repair protein YgfZ